MGGAHTRTWGQGRPPGPMPAESHRDAAPRRRLARAQASRGGWQMARCADERGGGDGVPRCYAPPARARPTLCALTLPASSRGSTTACPRPTTGASVKQPRGCTRQVRQAIAHDQGPSDELSNEGTRTTPSFLLAHNMHWQRLPGAARAEGGEGACTRARGGCTRFPPLFPPRRACDPTPHPTTDPRPFLLASLPGLRGGLGPTIQVALPALTRQAHRAPPSGWVYMCVRACVHEHNCRLGVPAAPGGVATHGRAQA